MTRCDSSTAAQRLQHLNAIHYRARILLGKCLMRLLYHRRRDLDSGSLLWRAERLIIQQKADVVCLDLPFIFLETGEVKVNDCTSLLTDSRW